MTGSVIAIANEKGGVAKTTTALSLGGAFAEAGYRVLLVDLDPQRNLSTSLGIYETGQSNSLIGLFMDERPILESIIATQVVNLSLIPSSVEIGLAEQSLSKRQNYTQVLSDRLSSILSDFDYILVDCPAFLGAILLNALTAADLLLIPTQPEYYSIFALRNMMNIVSQVRQDGNSKLRYRLLLTMFDKRNSIHHSMSAHLRDTFANGVLDTVIEIDTKLRESPILGLPIMFHAPKSRASLQYRFLAQEIDQYVKNNY